MKNLNSTDWRARRMARIRELIKQADPDIQEEVKYKTPSNPDGVFVWYKNGMLTTGETYKNHLRFTFSKGPVLKEWDCLLYTSKFTLKDLFSKLKEIEKELLLLKYMNNLNFAECASILKMCIRDRS